MVRLKLFWRNQCPKCPSAKKLLDKAENVDYHNIEEPEGLAEASYYGVMATPTIIVTDEERKELCSWRGEVPTAEALAQWMSK